MREHFREAFVPRAPIYWADLLASAAVGWSGFAVALVAWGGPLAFVAAAVSLFGLYRAALFIHELAHLRKGRLPGFEIAWHLLVGLPMLAPSLMYVGSHGDHHRGVTYGTAGDPEYETFASWGFGRHLLAAIGLTLVPVALVLRWGVFGPISYLVPLFRRLVVGHLSTLVVNAAYQRRAPEGEARRRWWGGEAGAALVVWSGAAGFAMGVLPLRAIALWYAILAGILLLNHVRTLAAHRYRSGGEPLDRMGELLDTVNLVEPAPLMALFAPVGMRFHALHHVAPTLPYHSLGRVHRALLEQLPEGSAYHRAEVRSLGTALGALIREPGDEGATRAA